MQSVLAPRFPHDAVRRYQAPALGLLLAVLAACGDSPIAPTLPEIDGAGSSSPVPTVTSAGGAGASTEGAGASTGGAGASAGGAGGSTGGAVASDAPTPAGPATIVNPLRGSRLFVETNTNAARQASLWRQSRPADAAQMDKIASQPAATWFGDWNKDPFSYVRQVTTRIRGAGSVPVYILYNIPLRDCGLWSTGGASSATEYLHWISEVGRGIGGEPAIVILEPDAIAGMDCLSAGDQTARIDMIRKAVDILKGLGRVSVYLDAGNARWHGPQVIADRLQRAGMAAADGFALNISNFLSNSESITYGDAVSARTGGKHFVIDTSRNGAGPTANSEWCNPQGRALGTRPTTETGHANVDAFLWLKTPGESDGECNGGPAAGVWWPEYALGLAQRS